jgi:hypothetical protein
MITPADIANYVFGTEPPSLTSVQLDKADGLVTERFEEATVWADQAMAAALGFLDELKAMSTLMPEASSYALMELVKAKLEYYITNGWQGLGSGIEDAIYKRMWERDEFALQTAKARAANDWSESGFSLPDGVLTSLWADLDKQNHDARLTQSREIAVMMAEYAFKFQQFVIEQAIKLYVTEEQVRLETYTALLKLREAIVEGGARVATQIAASALSGINASASLSASASVGESNNKSQSLSNNINVGLSHIEEHIYQEK